MKLYDWIILGGGGAGLSLVNKLISSNIKGNILLIEKEKKDKNDRTWCFWKCDDIDDIPPASNSWDRGIIRTKKNEKKLFLAPTSYRLLRSKIFYQSIYEKISKDSRVEIIYNSVQSIDIKEGYVDVSTKENTYRGQWAFNSLIQHAPIPSDVYRGLKQHFHGLWIETKQDIFNSEAFTMMDFQVNQSEGVQFIYILPTSPRKALIEYTVFSPNPWKRSEYISEIHSYISKKLGIDDFTIEEEEQGVIPMSPYAFPRVSERRLIHIGTAGGMTKASTGYTFIRIQEDSEQILQNLLKNGTPFPLLLPKSRSRFYDRLLIWLIKHQPEMIPTIFYKLFSRNSPHKVLNFLTEKTSLIQEIGIFFTLPWIPFLTALWHEYFKPNPKNVLGSSTNHRHLNLPASQLVD